MGDFRADVAVVLLQCIASVQYENRLNGTYWLLG